MKLKGQLLILFYATTLLGCVESTPDSPAVAFESINTAGIPAVTVLKSDSLLKLENGVYRFAGKPFWGFLKETDEDGKLISFGSYAAGRQQGSTKTFFSNGQLATLRSYKEGIGYGRHLGYWENGKPQFDFLYYNDKKEGLQRQWYESGKPYCALHFSDDREHGMQQAWLENGNPYINYEVKNGARYGLQKSVLCYTLTDEKRK